MPFFAIAGLGMQRDWRPLIPALSIALVMLTRIFTRSKAMGMWVPLTLGACFEDRSDVSGRFESMATGHAELWWIVVVFSCISERRELNRRAFG